MDRIVIKVGSNVLTKDDGTIDVNRISSIVDQIIKLRKKGYEVILVSSGAVAAGRSSLKSSAKLDSIEQRQLFSAIGQIRLVSLYSQYFGDYGVKVGQVLTMKENFSTRKAYLNQRNCIDVMLRCNVVPVVNENDTVSLTELMFTDNDELSGLVASMMDAKTLLILSNIDSIWNGQPGAPGTSVIRSVEPDEDLTKYIQSGKSGFGRGGMTSKYTTARKVADEGIRVIIANGKKDNIITSIFSGKDTVCTVFKPKEEAVSSMKKWIAHSAGFAKGVIVINQNAAKALKSGKAVSLLLVGVTRIEGSFEEGDIVSIVDDNGKEIAVGRTSMDSVTATGSTGEHDQKPIVHYDYLYLNQ